MRRPFSGPVANKQGRLVLVTGAGSGIGRAISLRQAAAGDIVIATDVDLAAAEETVKLADGACQAYQLDVRKPEQWEQVLDTVISRFGVPDILVNNAGIALGGAVLDLTAEDWDKILSINVYGVLNGSKIVGSKMIESGQPGHIVVIASGAAWTPNRVAAAYTTSKAAALMIAESLRIELGPRNIGVSAICPGVTRTQLSANATLVMSATTSTDELRNHLSDLQSRYSFATPDMVARAVQRAIRFNLAIVPVNFDATLAWVIHRISPGLMRGICSILSMETAENTTRLLAEHLPKSVAFHRTKPALHQ